MVDKVKEVAKRQIRILYITTFILLAIGAYSVYNTNHQAYLACKRVQSLQEYATDTIDRSEKTLPTLSYYKDPAHRDELLNQLNNIKESKKAFKPVTCHRNVFGG